MADFGDLDPFDIEGTAAVLPKLHEHPIAKCPECGDEFEVFPSSKTICGLKACQLSRDEKVARKAKLVNTENGKWKFPRRVCRFCKVSYRPDTKNQRYCKRGVCSSKRRSTAAKARRRENIGKVGI